MFRASVCMIAVSISATIANANCEAISKYGVYDVSTSMSETDRALAFRTWFCQQQFSSEEEASGVGGDIGFGEFKLGFDSNSQSWSEFNSSYCRDESYASEYSQTTVSFVRSINSFVVDALKECVTQRGLHAWIEQSSDPMYFRFRTVFNPAADDDYPIVESFFVAGGDCEGAMEVGVPIGPDGTELLCWRSSDDGVEVLFDADSFVIKDTPLSLQPIFRPPPTPLQQPIFIRAVEFSTSRDVMPASGVTALYGVDVILNAPPYNNRPNMVEYQFNVQAGGRYVLEAEYAAANSRPVELVINGQTVRNAALNEVTGCWTPNCQRWLSQGEVTLRTGENIMRVQSTSVFPHIRAFRFQPVN